MTETKGPGNQPPQPAQSSAPPQYPGPQYPNQPYPNQPYPGQQQYQSPQYPNANPQPQFPQFGAVPPGYPNAQYGGAQYGGYGAGPYNAYNGPYGYPMGYYAQPTSTNGMAIASLVLGICGFLCVTPFVGLGLGIAALSRINKTGQPGKGMAIAGIILSSLWIGLLLLIVITGGFHLGAGNGTGPGPSVGQTQAPDGTSA